MSVERWHAKADAFATGWHAKFGVFPSKHCIVLALAQAEHETSCGDSSVATKNWGAIQKRKLEPVEKAALQIAGIVPQYPKPGFIASARNTLAAAIEVGMVPPLVDEELYVDSSPKPQGPEWYWVMFWAFATDEEGAALFVHTIAEVRHSCRALLENDAATPTQYAAALYATRYFEGKRKPKAWYALVGGKWTEVAQGTPGAISGGQLNVIDYANAMGNHMPGIQAALQDWEPAEPKADPVSLANAARLWKLSADVAMGRGEGLGALDELEDTDPDPPAAA